jgi:hypothetical protein
MRDLNHVIIGRFRSNFGDIHRYGNSDEYYRFLIVNGLYTWKDWYTGIDPSFFDIKFSFETIKGYIYRTSFWKNSK